MLEQLKQFFSHIQSTLISGLSALLIIVVGFLLFNYFSQINKETASTQTVTVEESTNSGLLTEATKSSIFDETDSSKSGTKPTPSKEESSQVPSQTGQTRYTVKSGDTLSNIARTFYGNPDQYTLIVGVKENNISNPNLIHAGNVFAIPSSATAQAGAPLSLVKQLPAAGIGVNNPDVVNQSTETNVHNSYSVKAGDTLWSIAEKYYSDGYQWAKILEANLDRVGFLPNALNEQALIMTGQTLVIPGS